MKNKTYLAMVVRPYMQCDIQVLSWNDIVNCISEGTTNRTLDKARLFPGARDIIIIFNDTCKLDNMPLNRVFVNEEGRVLDSLEGTFVIIRYNPDSEGFDSLTANQIEKLSEMFNDWTKPINIMSFGQDTNYKLYKLFISKSGA